MIASQECVRLRQVLKLLLVSLILPVFLSACAGNFDGKFCLPTDKVECADLRKNTDAITAPALAVEGG